MLAADLRTIHLDTDICWVDNWGRAQVAEKVSMISHLRKGVMIRGYNRRDVVLKPGTEVTIEGLPAVPFSATL